MPTLIIAANIPDIDALATLLGGHHHLAIRRGITHGPIAMLLLPILLWGMMLWFDRWQAKRGTRPIGRPATHSMWLLALAYIGCLSHPLFDWFNSYGIRLLEPFSSRWFYGDTIFIVDIWLWLALIAGVWISLRRERKGAAHWRGPAIGAFTAICAYILANGLITARAERITEQAVIGQFGIEPTLVVANPVPVQFWKREMLWRNQSRFGYGWFTAPSSVFVGGKVRSHGGENPQITTATADSPDARAYLFWSRMPVFEIVGKDAERQMIISDQRFGNPMVRDRFVVSVPLKGDE